MNPMHRAVQTANLHDDRQVALLKAGLHAVGHLAERWALTCEAKARLLGDNERGQSTPHASLERVSHLLGIYRAASALFNHRQSSLLRWLHAANTASPFAGSSPIDVILRGRNLDEVRGYLECQLVA
jgi:hypothetical protein